MKNYLVRIIIEKDENDRYVAFAPSLPGCHTEGESYNDAMANMREAVDLYLETIKKPNLHLGNTDKTRFVGVEDLKIKV